MKRWRNILCFCEALFRLPDGPFIDSVSLIRIRSEGFEGIDHLLVGLHNHGTIGLPNIQA